MLPQHFSLSGLLSNLKTVSVPYLLKERERAASRPLDVQHFVRERRSYPGISARQRGASRHFAYYTTSALASSVEAAHFPDSGYPRRILERRKASEPFALQPRYIMAKVKASIFHIIKILK